MTLSLAQFVAEQGGISPVGGSLAGELTRIRELNRTLRGWRSVVRSRGMEWDRMAGIAREQGYPVETDASFFDALELDATALAAGRLQDRIFPDYELGALDEYPEELEAPCLESLNTSCHPCRCKVCGVPDPTELCDDCAGWAVEVITAKETEIARDALWYAYLMATGTEESLMATGTEESYGQEEYASAW